jgi:hypothetical protein
MTETHPQKRRLGYARVSTFGQTLCARGDEDGECSTNDMLVV